MCSASELNTAAEGDSGKAGRGGMNDQGFSGGRGLRIEDFTWTATDLEDSGFSFAALFRPFANIRTWAQTRSGRESGKIETEATHDSGR